MTATFTFPDGATLRLADVAQVGPLVLLKHFYQWTDIPTRTTEERVEHRLRRWWWPFREVITVEMKQVTMGGGRSGEPKPEWSSYEFRVQDAAGRTLVIWPTPVVRTEPTLDQWNTTAWARVTTATGIISNPGPLEVQWAPERSLGTELVQGVPMERRAPAGPALVPEEGFEHCRRPAVEAVRDALVNAWKTS